MRILGFEKDQGACNHYRILQPLYKMKQHGLADILTIHPHNASDLEFVMQKILEAEIVVFQRPQDDAWLNFMRVAQKHGKIIVVDYDDNPFEVSPMNPAYKYYGTKEVQFKHTDGTKEMVWENGKNGFDLASNITRRDYFQACFRSADMVSTTTNVLRDIFLKLNKNTIVLPNLIDVDLYPKLDCVKKEIRIGWQGGYSHYEDLYMIAPAIKKILKKYDNTKFVYLGDTGFRGLFKGIPENRIEWNGWINQVAYTYRLITLNLDIGLCPVVDNTFNRNKSAIKFFEYSMVGAASIASNIPPYSPVMSHERDCLLAGPDDWFQAIEVLVRDEIKRIDLAKNAYDNVFENHNSDTKAHLWKEAYETLLKSDVIDMVEV